MIFDTLPLFLRHGAAALAKGPIALILLEDEVEIDSTVRHHLDTGFKSVVVFGVADLVLQEDVAHKVTRVHHDMTSDNALTDVVNGVIKAAPGQWLYYAYNAEYLFFPFCEHRSIAEMLAFTLEERRHSVLTYVIDLYSADLKAHPNAVDLEEAYLDKSGYYAEPRWEKENAYLDRQKNFFGGLRWRFEELIPYERRRIDRIGLFRAKPGLTLRAEHTLSDAEYNTYACPWHNNITAAICSFRTAKALKRNPGSARHIRSFKWYNSTRFDWHSRQLMDLGLMEPGQWF